MEAVVFQSRALIQFPNLISLRRTPIFALKDGYPSKNIQVSAVTSNGDGNAGNRRPPRRSLNESSTKKTHKKEEDSRKQKSKNQEEIIAIFRKIQTSIAEESASSNDDDSDKDEHGAGSVLEGLLESGNQVKGKKTSKRGVTVLRRKGKSEEKEGHHQLNLPDADFKLIRPPSNFVKRSPIPSSTGGNGSHNRAEAFPHIDDMKLTELKSLAKSRGIKGYSKLKKNELMEILRSS